MSAPELVEPIDHRAEAEATLRDGYPEKNADYLAHAQVHATLYAAEQQRIANLIAFTSRPGFIQTPDILQQIEKGLGI